MLSFLFRHGTPGRLSLVNNHPHCILPNPTSDLVIVGLSTDDPPLQNLQSLVNLARRRSSMLRSAQASKFPATNISDMVPLWKVASKPRNSVRVA